MNQPTAQPTRKVATAGGAGALVLILVWVLEEFAGISIPAEVASALTVLVSFAAAYVVPERAGYVGEHRTDA